MESFFASMTPGGYTPPLIMSHSKVVEFSTWVPVATQTSQENPASKTTMPDYFITAGAVNGGSEVDSLDFRLMSCIGMRTTAIGPDIRIEPAEDGAVGDNLQPSIFSDGAYYPITNVKSIMYGC